MPRLKRNWSTLYCNIDELQAAWWLRDYEDVLEIADIYSLIALTSFYSKVARFLSLACIVHNLPCELSEISGVALSVMCQWKISLCSTNSGSSSAIALDILHSICILLMPNAFLLGCLPACNLCTIPHYVLWRLLTFVDFCMVLLYSTMQNAARHLSSWSRSWTFQRKGRKFTHSLHCPYSCSSPQLAFAKLPVVLAGVVFLLFRFFLSQMHTTNSSQVYFLFKVGDHEWICVDVVDKLTISATQNRAQYI